MLERKQKVIEAAREQGAAYVDMSLMKQHFQEIGNFLRQTQLEQGGDAGAENWEQWQARWQEWEAFLKTISEGFDNQGFQYSLIADGKAAPANEWERINLSELADATKAQQAENPTADPDQEPDREADSNDISSELN